jgi:acyl-CoA reductase-like NAD-dependent aldehyde dehydrogenase
MRLAGRKVGAGRGGDRVIEVFNPYTEKLLGTVPKATLEEVREAFAKAHAFKPQLTRYERAAILNRAAAIIQSSACPRSRT